MSTKGGTWVTIKGAHIFIKDGETTEEAFDRLHAENEAKKLQKYGDNFRSEKDSSLYMAKDYNDKGELAYKVHKTGTSPEWYDNEEDAVNAFLAKEKHTENKVEKSEKKSSEPTEKEVKDLWIGGEDSGIVGNVILNAVVDNTVKAYEGTPIEKTVPDTLKSKYKGYVEKFDNMMDTLNSEQTVFRGERIPRDSDFNEKDILRQQKRYTSTTLSKSVAEGYAGVGDDEYSIPVIYEIKMKKGTKYVDVGTDAERVLGRNQKYKITKKQKKYDDFDEYYYVQLEVSNS